MIQEGVVLKEYWEKSGPEIRRSFPARLQGVAARFVDGPTVHPLTKECKVLVKQIGGKR